MTQRNVLVVGQTGHGKSTLCNVVCGWQDRFHENDLASAGTTKIQAEDVDVDDMRLHVVDTVGLGDAQVANRDVLGMIVDVVEQIGGPIHQILFVVGIRFSDCERKALEYLSTHLFGSDVYAHVTVVKTHVPRFTDPAYCAEDKAALKSMSPLFERMQVLHVDNPTPDDAPSTWQTTRATSRQYLLTQLRICSSPLAPGDISAMRQRAQEVMSIEEQAAKAAAEREKLEQERLQLDAERRRSEAEIQRTKEILSQQRQQADNLRRQRHHYHSRRHHKDCTIS